jgi:hypothetical protein
MTIKLPRNQKLAAAEMKSFGANRDLWMEQLNGTASGVAMTEPPNESP